MNYPLAIVFSPGPGFRQYLQRLCVDCRGFLPIIVAGRSVRTPDIRWNKVLDIKTGRIDGKEKTA
jgi:hypothetical protein